MYRSEALAAQERAQAAVQEAKDALYWATMDLQDAECDHPDTNGPTCAHCGEFYISPESLEFGDNYRVFVADRDDLRAGGFPPPPTYSEYVF